MKKIKISKELKIGVFAIIIIATGYWGINFLKGVDILSSNSVYYAYYNTSENIEASAPILLRGIKIGTVTGVDIESVDSQVRVEMTVNKKFKIPTNSIAMLTDKSLMGGKAIAITIGDSKTILKNDDVMDSKVNNKLNNQIEEAKDMLNDIVVKLTKTLDNVNELLDEENIANITATLGSVSSMSNSLDQMIKSEQSKISMITTDLGAITSEFKSSMPSFKNTLANLDSITSSINGSDIGQTIKSANSAIESLDKTLYSLNSGTGTAGKLLNDPALYDNLSGLLTDLKENPKRYVHFSLFGRKDK